MTKVSAWIMGSLVAIGCARCLDSLRYQDNTALSTGTAPVEVKAIDLNRDGALDLIVANTGISQGMEEPGINSSIDIFLNLGDGSFGAPQTLSIEDDNGATLIVAHSSLSTAAGDVDQDGDLDLVVGGLGLFSFSVFFQQGDGSFVQGPTVPLTVGLSAPLSSVELFDINTDGALDILAIDNFGAGEPAVFLGDGQGSFGAGRALPETSLCLFFESRCADFNNDGNQDFVSILFAETSSDTEAKVGIFLAKDDGTFDAPIEIPSLLDLAAFFEPDGEDFIDGGDVGLGDFDGDNDLDLVAAHQMFDGTERDTFREFAAVTFLQNTGNNTFSAPELLFETKAGLLTDARVRISVDDLELDGRPELLVVQDKDDQVRILRDTGNGLQKDAALRLGDSLGRPVTADLNGDGALDIITAQRARSLLHISLSRP